MHTFKRDDIVCVFQMSPSRGLLYEGKAVVRKIVPDIDEQYEVTFITEPDETYERFVDAEPMAQANPAAYVQQFNKRIGYVD